MSHSVKQIVLCAALLGLLVYVAVRGWGGKLADVWRAAPGQKPPETEVDKQESLDRYGFRLNESARGGGIEFTHQAPTLDKRLEHIMPLVNPMGAAVAVVDFDADGWLDLYAVTSKEGGKNALYRNRGGAFENMADEAGVADLNLSGTGVCMGSVWADYDNDGYPDLFVYKWGKPELFRSRYGRRFERMPDCPPG
jgi:hypothetical protein